MAQLLIWQEEAKTLTLTFRLILDMTLFWWIVSRIWRVSKSSVTQSRKNYSLDRTCPQTKATGTTRSLQCSSLSYFTRCWASLASKQSPKSCSKAPWSDSHQKMSCTGTGTLIWRFSWSFTGHSSSFSQIKLIRVKSQIETIPGQSHIIKARLHKTTTQLTKKCNPSR